MQTRLLVALFAMRLLSAELPPLAATQKLILNAKRIPESVIRYAFSLDHALQHIDALIDRALSL